MKAKTWILRIVVGALILVAATAVLFQIHPSDGEAEFLQARAYQRGEGVPLNFAKAAELYRKAAADGNAKAMHNLGYLYDQGKGVPRDPDESLKWYRLGAEHGAVRSQEKLGYSYLQGQGVAKDARTAVQWFQKAAEQGSDDAQLQLGLLYYLGDTDVPQNNSQAAKWLTLSVGQGNAMAENYLGKMNEDGDGMQRNEKQAVTLYTEAAEKGNGKAQWNLGRVYFEGKDVPRDPIQAYTWLKLSSDQGDFMAQHLLKDYTAGKGFTDAEIAEGNRRVAKFKSEHPVVRAFSVRN